MRNYKEVISFLIVLFTSSCIQKVSAQALNINGDTIFVNAEAEIQVNFPTLPNSFSTAPRDASYDLKSVGNGVNIIARTENSSPATLLVSEGGRNHNFKIVFKKDINYDNQSELVYDFSTVKKIEGHNRDKKPGGLNQPKNNDIKPNANNVPVTTNLPTAQTNSNDNYITIAANAKTLFDQKKYEEAKGAYNQALASRPGDLYATSQIEKIDKLLQTAAAIKDLQSNEKLYNDNIHQGEMAFNKNQLAVARIAYEQALLYKPNNALATSRLKLIDEKEEGQKANEELENNYNTAIQSADKLFQAGDYSNAKIEYTRALGFIKKTWPQEQIDKIEKILTGQKKQEQEQLIAEKLAREKQTLETNYDAAVQAADNFFKTGDYEKAKKKYFEALNFIKKEWPQDQINKINKITADKEAQELEHKYSAAMEGADKYFLAGDYKNAKVIYDRAVGLIPRPEPREKIKEIDKILADQEARAIAERKTLEEEAAITLKYTAIIKNADVEFDKKNYNKAKQMYAQASALKSAEEYPKEKLSLIENVRSKIALDEKAKKDSIASAKEINTKYNQSISKARFSYSKNDLLKAKLFYEEAASLKPQEEIPKSQLKIINDKLEVIIRENEFNRIYESKIALADSQVIAKSYDLAFVTYNEALKLKPAEEYPKKQLKYLQSEFAEIKRREEIKKRQDEEVRYNNAIERGNKAAQEKRYVDAKSAFTEALTIHPENETIKKRLEIFSYQVEKEEVEKLKQQASKDSAAAPSKSKKGRKNKSPVTQNKISDQSKSTSDDLVSQAESIPYTDAELKSKYPNINFFTLPPEQPFNKSAVESDKTLQTCNKMLLEKPRLDFSANDHEIKLICQGINFEETTAYIKLLIQNYSAADFLTGAMMLTWIKKTANHIKLYPSHLFPAPLPVIKPGNEAIVIYACKTYSILDEETLSFELIDRLKKVKLQIKIPGSAYNQEWVRYE